MSESIIGALIGAGITLITTIATLLTNLKIEKNRSQHEFDVKQREIKIEKLNDIYLKLISIINLYPDVSPNDILTCVEYPPNYLQENFDVVLRSLDYQIEDYEKLLQNTGINSERKNDIETQISNRKYSKQKILKIHDKYNKAKEQYKSFCESDKMVFDLYAGQNVRNCLVEFEVVIHNVFISGHKAGDEGDPINNIIQVSRRKLIDNIRSDI